MSRQKTLVIFSLCLFALLSSSCGIGEDYYLPQIPESAIVRSFNTAATINIPSNLLDDVAHYATGYVIFYKIYTSDTTHDTVNEILNNNARISNDYSALLQFIDPANAASIPSLTTFSGRGFYELELAGTNIRNTVLSKNGGMIRIQFDPIPGTRPSVEFNGDSYSLLRSNGGGTFNPRPTDRFFFSSPELNDFANATPVINADVSGQSGIPEFAYVSMYIAAVGQNPNTFSRLYGKPTHISIFKLPNVN